MSDQINEAAKKVFVDWEAECLGGAFTEAKRKEGAPENGTALPPKNAEGALTYFAAVHSGHFGMFQQLNGYVRTLVYEAINGHKDYVNGTPISSWSDRAKYDRNELIRVFDALRGAT